VRHCEEKEKAAHPVQRIMAIEDTAEGVARTHVMNRRHVMS